MKRLFIIFLLILAGCGAQTVDPAVFNLANCLTENNAVMYGAFWCPHCQQQKKAFGPAFEDVNYIECDPKGPNGNPDLCLEKDIQGYPTWVFNDEKRISGFVPLETLARLSECPYEGKV